MKYKILTIALVLFVGVGVFIFEKTKEPITIVGDAIFPVFTKEMLVNESDLVVIGTIVSTEAKKQPSIVREGSDDIVTIAKVHIEQVLSGEVEGSEMLVETPGGTVGRVTMQMSGAATFEEGERTLLFLFEKDGGMYGITGWQHGKYTLDAAGNIVSNKDIFKNMFGDIQNISEIKL